MKTRNVSRLASLVGTAVLSAAFAQSTTQPSVQVGSIPALPPSASAPAVAVDTTTLLAGGSTPNTSSSATWTAPVSSQPIQPVQPIQTQPASTQPAPATTEPATLNLPVSGSPIQPAQPLPGGGASVAVDGVANSVVESAANNTDSTTQSLTVGNQLLQPNGALPQPKPAATTAAPVPSLPASLPAAIKPTRDIKLQPTQQPSTKQPRALQPTRTLQSAPTAPQPIQAQPAPASSSYLPQPYAPVVPQPTQVQTVPTLPTTALPKPAAQAAQPLQPTQTLQRPTLATPATPAVVQQIANQPLPVGAAAVDPRNPLAPLNVPSATPTRGGQPMPLQSNYTQPLAAQPTVPATTVPLVPVAQMQPAPAPAPVPIPTPTNKPPQPLPVATPAPVASPVPVQTMPVQTQPVQPAQPVQMQPVQIQPPVQQVQPVAQPTAPISPNIAPQSQNASAQKPTPQNPVSDIKMNLANTPFSVEQPALTLWGGVSTEQVVQPNLHLGVSYPLRKFKLLNMEFNSAARVHADFSGGLSGGGAILGVDLLAANDSGNIYGGPSFSSAFGNSSGFTLGAVVGYRDNIAVSTLVNQNSVPIANDADSRIGYFLEGKLRYVWQKGPEKDAKYENFWSPGLRAGFTYRF